MLISREELKERLEWPLDKKISHFIKVFTEFFVEYKGHVYLSFSGGKDSQVGCDIIDKIWDGTFKNYLPDVIWELVVSHHKPPKVFANTGLEYPEIVDHVRTFDNVVIVKPKMGFTRVIKEVGVSVVSKDVAQKIKEIRTTKSEKLLNKRLYGDSKGNGKIPEKWKPLIDAPFPISDKCCYIFKKEPFKRYQKETGRKPVMFTQVTEGTLRSTAYRRSGCNSFEEGREKSRPYSIFTEGDTWAYHDKYGLKFCDVYYDRTSVVKQLDGSERIEKIEGVDRTGCTFCLFGLHLEPKDRPNRIQRLAVSHPKYYDIVINKCGLAGVLSWMKIPYKKFKPKSCQLNLFHR